MLPTCSGNLSLTGRSLPCSVQTLPWLCLGEFVLTCEQLTASSLTLELVWRQRNLTELLGKGWACLRCALSKGMRRLQSGCHSGADSEVTGSCSE